MKKNKSVSLQHCAFINFIAVKTSQGKVASDFLITDSLTQSIKKCILLDIDLRYQLDVERSCSRKIRALSVSPGGRSRSVTEGWCFSKKISCVQYNFCLLRCPVTALLLLWRVAAIQKFRGVVKGGGQGGQFFQHQKEVCVFNKHTIQFCFRCF